MPDGRYDPDTDTDTDSDTEWPRHRASDDPLDGETIADDASGFCALRRGKR